MTILRTRYKAAAATLAFAALSACTTIPAGSPTAASVETIEIEHGACFGFCPMYKASVSPDDRVAFEPVRFTRVETPVNRQGAAGTYDRVAALVGPLRPAAAGEYDISQQCDSQVTDLSDYHVRWRGPDGVRQVRFYPGCVNSQTEANKRRMDEAIEALNIEDLVVRPENR